MVRLAYWYTATMIHDMTPISSEEISSNPVSMSPARPIRSSLGLEDIPGQAFTEPKSGVWQRIVRWWNDTYPLEAELATVAAAFESAKTPLSEEAYLSTTIVPLFPHRHNIKDLVELIAIYTSHRTERGYLRTEQALRQLIGGLDNDTLNDLLFAMAEKRAIEGNNQANGQLLDTTLSLLSLERMQALIRYKNGQISRVVDGLDQLKEMAGDVAEFLAKDDGDDFRRNVQEATAGFLARTGNFFHSFFAAFFKAHDFSLEDEPPFDRAEANDRLSNIYQLIEKPLRVAELILAAAAIFSPTSWVPLAITAGVLLILIVALALLNKYHQSQLPLQLSNGFVNLTRAAEQGQLPPVIGRHAEVEGIVDCLGNLDRNSRKPLLIGQSGVGKTEIVSLLAQEIASGKHTELQGKQIYSINTAALLDSGMVRGGHSYTRLQVLLREIKGKEDDVILFFDEVHSIFARGGGSRGAQGLAQQFKILLDNPKIHCIAATTETDFEGTIGDDAALARRFRRINVAPLAAPDCHNMLRDLIRRDYPEMSISDEAIATAMALTDSVNPEVAQPAKAKDLIIEAVHAIRRYEGIERLQLKRAREEYERARTDLEQHGFVAATDGSMQERLQILRDLRLQMEILQTKIGEKDRQIQELEAFKVERKKWRQKYINLAHEVCDGDDENLATMGKAFLFLGDHMLDAYDAQIEKREAALQHQGMPTTINAEVITKLFRDKQEGGFLHLAEYLQTHCLYDDGSESVSGESDHAVHEELAQRLTSSLEGIGAVSNLGDTES